MQLDYAKKPKRLREPLAGLNTLPMVWSASPFRRTEHHGHLNEGAGGRGHIDRGATPTMDLCSRG
jgi:hypothetical protein